MKNYENFLAAFQLLQHLVSFSNSVSLCLVPSQLLQHLAMFSNSVSLCCLIAGIEVRKEGAASNVFDMVPLAEI